MGTGFVGTSLLLTIGTASVLAKSQNPEDIFLSEIGNYNYDASILRLFMEKHSFKVISSLINAKRFDLVALMLTNKYSNKNNFKSII